MCPVKTDQPGHAPSLIRVFPVRLKKAWVLSYPLGTLRRLRSDWADAQADLGLRWAHRSFCWFCHEAAHLLSCEKVGRCLRGHIQITILILKGKRKEPPHDKTNKMTCTQRRLSSVWADAQADQRLRWVHRSFCWFCHEAAHLVLCERVGLCLRGHIQITLRLNFNF